MVWNFMVQYSDVIWYGTPEGYMVWYSVVWQGIIIGIHMVGYGKILQGGGG